MEIQDYKFGRIVIDGEVYTQDIKIVRDRVVPGWHRRSGHRVEPDDVADILNAEPEVILLGKGEPGMMSSSGTLAALLEEKNIRLVEKPTKELIEIFNKMHKQGKKVAAGFHLTC